MPTPPLETTALNRATPVADGFAIQQFFALCGRKAGDSVHVLRRSQGFGPSRAKFESGVLLARRGKHDQGHDS